MDPKEVKLHIYARGFKLKYWWWFCHNEEERTFYRDHNLGSFTHENNLKAINKFENMIFFLFYDVGLNFQNSYNYYFENPPNVDTKKFYNMFNAIKGWLWEGCTRHTKLPTAVKMLSIKSDYNAPYGYFMKW